MSHPFRSTATTKNIITLNRYVIINHNMHNCIFSFLHHESQLAELRFPFSIAECARTCLPSLGLVKEELESSFSSGVAISIWGKRSGCRREGEGDREPRMNVKKGADVAVC